MEWGWPQWVVAVLYGLTVIVYAANEGKPRDGKYSTLGCLIGLAIMAFLLHKGGFW